jgi:hypothetical protein
MLVAEPKADKKAVFEAAARESARPVAPPPRRRRRPLPRPVANDDTAPAGHAAPPAEATAAPAPAEGQAPAVAETTVPADGCRPTPLPPAPLLPVRRPWRPTPRG